MLYGKNAIITGARTGIGLATLKQFVKSGANCWAVVHREDPDFLSLIQELEHKYDIWIKPVYIDLSDTESVKSGIKGILKEKLPVDVLVNAAGVVSPNRLFPMTSMNDIRKVMEVNFFSILEITQLIIRIMQKQKSGSIINIASISADCEDTSQLEYAASKAALICAAKKLANEVGAFGIRVNAVSPGLIDTKMTSGIEKRAMSKIFEGLVPKRLGIPDEIANIIAFLASDLSSFINGENIKADGGGVDLRLMVSNI